MRIIYNKFIPFKGFGAMNILGLVFSRKPATEVTLITKRHEQTHTYQQYELLMVAALVSLVLCNIFASWWYLLGCLIIPFAIYVMCFILEMVVPPYHNVQELFDDAEKSLYKRISAWVSKVWMDAYSDNCFEREAYMNDHDRNYLATRKLFAWVGYILKKDERKGK